MCGRSGRAAGDPPHGWPGGQAVDAPGRDAPRSAAALVPNWSASSATTLAPSATIARANPVATDSEPFTTRTYGIGQRAPVQRGADGRRSIRQLDLRCDHRRPGLLLGREHHGVPGDGTLTQRSTRFVAGGARSGFIAT